MRTYRLLIGGGTVLDTFRAADLQPALRVAHLLAGSHAAQGWHELRSPDRYQLQFDNGSGWVPVTTWSPETAGVPGPRTPID